MANKAILVGNVGKDPEIRYMPDGNPVANLSLATSEKWTAKDGTKQEKTEWHRIVIFGKLAELAGQYVKKGNKLYLEGKIQYREWEDKDGVKRQTTEIVLDQFNGKMEFLGGGNHAQSETCTEDQKPAKSYSPKPQGKNYTSPPAKDPYDPANRKQGEPTPTTEPDDIPF